MRTITTKKLKAAALTAYHAGTLTAQNERKCVLRSFNGNHCAIGVVMLDAEIAKANSATCMGSDVCLMVSAEVIAFEDVAFATELQVAHDCWCNSPEEMRKDDEAVFLALVRS